MNETGKHTSIVARTGRPGGLLIVVVLEYYSRVDGRGSNLGIEMLCFSNETNSREHLMTWVSTVRRESAWVESAELLFLYKRRHVP